MSGPAASVALVVLTTIQAFGSFEAVLPAIIVAGGIQIVMGFIGAKTIAYFFPSSMIKGILASIGLILIINQIPHAFGYAGQFEFIDALKAPGGGNAFVEAFKVMDHVSPGASIITITSLAIIIGWDRPSLKKR